MKVFQLLHRWLGRSFLIFWLALAISGVLSVWRADIDDQILGAKPTIFSPTAVTACLAKLEADGIHISSIWKSGGLRGQYDAYAEENGDDVVIRIDGQGSVLRKRAASDRFFSGGFWETLAAFHQNFLIGDFGLALVGVSGLCLMLAILSGIMRLGKLRSAARYPSVGGVKMRGRSLIWHRFLGIWMAAPGLVMAMSGVLLAFPDQTEVLTGGPPSLQASVSGSMAKGGDKVTDFNQAIDLALATFPGSEMTAVDFPSVGENWYTIRLRVPGEMLREYGASRVWVAASHAKVIGVHRATDSRGFARVGEALYPLHSGQIGGVFGRFFVLVTGLWLTGMAVLGTLIWKERSFALRRSHRRGQVSDRDAA